MANPGEVASARPAPVGFNERFMPGTLTWVTPAHAPAAEDRLITSAFHFLVDGGLSPARAREMGRALGRQSDDHSLGVYLDAFSHLGIGRLKVAAVDDERYTFTGEDLRGSASSNAPSCALALGFLEGATERATGTPALGAEMRCRSRGHDKCAFTIMTRR